MQNKHIYTQGYFDGACFLYSMANCYVALTGKQLKQETWDKIVLNVPMLHDFMSGTGTENYNSRMICNVLNNTLNCIHTKKAFQIDNININDVNRHIAKDSVVIAALKKDTERQVDLDHWVCCVGMHSESILIACSWADYGCFENHEKYDKSTGRWYNDRTNNKTVIVKDMIFAVRLK